MESDNKYSWNDSVENIGVIVDFEEEEEDSEPESNELVNILNRAINLGQTKVYETVTMEEPKETELAKSEIETKMLECHSFDEKEEILKIKEIIHDADDQDSQKNLLKEKRCSKYENDPRINSDKRNSFTNVYDTLNREANHTVKKKDNPNTIYTIGSHRSKEYHHLYENETERNAYENVTQYLQEENEYEEINFAKNPSNKMLKIEDDNYINVCAKSIPNESADSGEKSCQTTNTLKYRSGRKEKNNESRRWSISQEHHSQPLQKEHKRWSLKNDPTIKSILKQNNQKQKRIQSVNFRAEAKVKTFREPSSASYEPVDVVDYMAIKGEDSDYYDRPKNQSPRLVEPSGWENYFECQEGHCNVATQTEGNGTKENCALM
eukprot:GFUD01030231.1.p1 GENE.GFUD01030231.1~~GFUD01030231.1.p1  ORF type:complete len:412 (+),score=134.01 GFUD01030231.1:100-1236(+)